MKNLFHPGVKEEFGVRIGNLTADSTPLWGKMNVAQMLANCIKPKQLSMGEAESTSVDFLMKLMGNLVKRTIVSEKPFSQNLPTDPTFITTASQYDFDESKQQLIDTLNRFVEKQDIVPDFKHPFFGKLTKDEWGVSQYKHLDHHLRQFGK